MKKIYDTSYYHGLWYKLTVTEYYDTEIMFSAEYEIKVENSIGRDGVYIFDNRNAAHEFYFNLIDELDAKENMCSTDTSAEERRHWDKVFNAWFKYTEPATVN
jgi:hypothetical protein